MDSCFEIGAKPGSGRLLLLLLIALLVVVSNPAGTIAACRQGLRKPPIGFLICFFQIDHFIDSQTAIFSHQFDADVRDSRVRGPAPPKFYDCLNCAVTLRLQSFELERVECSFFVTAREDSELEPGILRL